jgi:hypothetical protein
MRDHEASHLTDRELDRAGRELAASLALSRPGSPILAPIQAQLAAINAEVAERAQEAPTASAMGRCSCGFATDDYKWMTCHLIEHPGHHEADSYGNWEPQTPQAMTANSGPAPSTLPISHG